MQVKSTLVWSFIQRYSKVKCQPTFGGYQKESNLLSSRRAHSANSTPDILRWLWQTYQKSKSKWNISDNSILKDPTTQKSVWILPAAGSSQMKGVLQVQIRNVHWSTWWKLKKFRGDDVLWPYCEYKIAENNASLLKFTHMASFSFCLPI